ncbi:MAG: phage holin family protein [Verrucomicrobiales bacterium]
MNTTSTATTVKRESMLGLLGDLQQDAKNVFKKEIELAKTELSEKLSAMGKHSGLVGAGAAMAAIGAVILIMSLGFIIAYGLEAAGLSERMAEFLGFLIVAVITTAIGAVLAMKGLNALKHSSLAPEKAIETYRDMRGTHATETAKETIKVEAPKQNSDEIKTELEITRLRMDQEMDELKNRLTPRRMLDATILAFKRDPLRAALITAGTGLGGLLLFKARSHRH